MATVIVITSMLSAVAALLLGRYIWGGPREGFSPSIGPPIPPEGGPTTLPQVEVISDERYAVSSHIGPRPNNEDAAIALPSDGKGVMLIEGIPYQITTSNNLRFDLYAVADGVGGHEKGELASRIAIETLKEYLEHYGTKEKEYEPISILVSAFEEANNRILRYSSSHPQARGMATTLTAALVDKSTGTVYWAHAGDTRLYVVDQDGAIERITEDHSYVAELVKLGQITEEEAESHPQRNVITKALGISERVGPSTGKFVASKGSKIVLCSDGLHDVVKDEDIASVVSKSPMEEAARHLIELALERNTSDNSTVLIASVM